MATHKKVFIIIFFGIFFSLNFIQFTPLTLVTKDLESSKGEKKIYNLGVIPLHNEFEAHF